VQRHAQQGQQQTRCEAFTGKALFFRTPAQVKVAPRLPPASGIREGVLKQVTDRPIVRLEPPSLAATHPWTAIGRLAASRDLLITLTLHRIRVRYAQSRLGAAWAVLQPLGIMLAFALVFSLLGGAPTEGVPYALFAYAALVPWTAFASGLSNTTTALTGHAALITKVAFPREILPLTYVVAALVDALLASCVLAVLMVWYAVAPTVQLPWAVVALGLLALLLVGAGLLLSAIQVRHRDVGLAIPVLLQVWMFATPVVYPLSLARDQLSPSLYAVYLANPMAGITDTFRRATVLQQAPDAQALMMSTAVVALLLPFAYLYFKHAEFTMADVV
jgi:lipopolysaccharide transport system permease protein